ncbi:MAG: LacI family transcriptional regulator [Bacteroidetes bacterium]|nr:LacI family transcriptional regulator [Bacteroidota bacterium]
MTSKLADIAEYTGLSISTVSRVVNGHTRKYRISDKTKDLILSAANELNYRPNALARGLRLKKSHSIGLVVPDISNPFFAFVTRIIQNYAHSSGYSLIVCNTDESIDSEKEQIELLLSKGVDGFIIMPVGIESAHIEELLKENYPMVLLDRCFESLNTNSVLVDNYMGSYTATEHLISLGHRDIAIILGLKNTYTTNERLRGYKKALEDHNIIVNSNYIVGKDYRIENGYIETKFLLNLETRPSAIFTTSDLITVGALKAIYEENLKISEDISIVAFDDSEFAPFLKSPLTAIRQPKEIMGEMAVKLLLADINSNKSDLEKSKIVLKPKLIIRESVSDKRVLAVI